MADGSILFSPDMIRALDEGRKHQTRRLLTPAHIRFFDPERGSYRPSPELIERAFEEAEDFRIISPDIAVWTAKAFDYQLMDRTHWQGSLQVAIGDRLWVREAWRTTKALDDLKPSEIHPASLIEYEASRPSDTQPLSGKYRHARFMPRWVSRFTLTIEQIRIQELLQITEEDAAAEGFQPGKLDDGFDPVDIGGGVTVSSPGTWASAAGHFQLYWQKLHPEWDGFSSPPVIAFTFSLTRDNIDASF